MATPKIAVLLCGYLRTWDICRDSFMIFMKDINYDLFIHTYTTIKGYHPYIRDTYNVRDNDVSASLDEVTEAIGLPYKKLVIEDEGASMDEIKAVEQKDLECYQWPDYDAYHDLQVLKGKGISIRTYLQYRKFRLCNELRKEYETETGTVYDVVVKVRADIDYTDMPPLRILLQDLGSLNPGNATEASASVSKLASLDAGKGTEIQASVPKLGSTTILTSSADCQPSDRIYIGMSSDIDKLLFATQYINFPLDREYNPHEYLFGLLGVMGLTNMACIPGLKLTYG